MNESTRTITNKKYIQIEILLSCVRLYSVNGCSNAVTAVGRDCGSGERQILIKFFALSETTCFLVLLFLK